MFYAVERPLDAGVYLVEAKTGKTLEPLPVSAPNQSGGGACVLTGDLAGDYRDEVVCIGKSERGNAAVLVYTNIEPVHRRAIARSGRAGYGPYFEWEP